MDMGEGIESITVRENNLNDREKGKGKEKESHANIYTFPQTNEKQAFSDTEFSNRDVNSKYIDENQKNKPFPIV